MFGTCTRPGEHLNLPLKLSLLGLIIFAKQSSISCLLFFQSETVRLPTPKSLTIVVRVFLASIQKIAWSFCSLGKVTDLRLVTEQNKMLNQSYTHIEQYCTVVN